MNPFKKKEKITQKPVSFAIGISRKTEKINAQKEIEEAFKGTVSKKFNSLIGSKLEAEPHPFNYEDMSTIAKNFGPMNAAINKFVNYAVVAGMSFKSEQDDAETIINNFAEDVQLKWKSKRWLKQALKKGFSPMEISFSKDAKGNKIVDGLKVLNSNNIFKVRDSKGNTTGYVQLKSMPSGTSLNASLFNEDNIIRFKPWEILELNIDQSDDDPYGIGIVYPNQVTIKHLLNANLEMHTMMERKANSPIHAKMGFKENKDGPISPNPNDIDEMKTKLEDLRNDQEWVTNDMVDMKVLDFGNVGDKFTGILESDKQDFSTGVEVPMVLLGNGNIAEGLANVQLQDFQVTSSSVQEEISRVLERQLFPLVLRANGLDERVEVVWGAQDKQETNQRITQITTLLQNPMLDPSLRLELELQLAELMGLDKSNIIPAEQKTQELMDQKQPSVPGQNRKLGQCNHNHLKAMSDESQYYENVTLNVKEFMAENPDCDIKEWVGFNYISFINQILGEIEAYEFPELRGVTAEQIANGKFSSKQVEALREVLKEGFEKGRTIREITNQIEKEVNPKDLKYVDKYGNDRVVPAKIRSPMIARTETTRMAARGNVRNYKWNGIEEVRYLAVLDERTSPICEELNGKIFPVEQAIDIIPPHPYCRSTFIPITDLDRE